MIGEESLTKNSFDVIIVGGGPAGSACALSLAESGLDVCLMDKAKFPRDKVCGDALSLDVVNQLAKLSPQLDRAFHDCALKTASSGVRLFSPDLTCIDLPFIYKGEKKNGYLLSRQDFDQLLIKSIKEQNGVRAMENCEVFEVTRSDDGVEANTSLGSFRAAMVVGADGANSVVRNLSGRQPIDRNHHSAGLRVYYKGVNLFHQDNFIELYFFNDILPGYFWIFPMEDGKANVGIGMLSAKVSKKKINLKGVLQRLITTHPILKDRFKNASPLERPKGHPLPLGSLKRSISGNRFLLLGDAAGLIDPFTGEGIGNAIRSGRVAAEHVIACFKAGNFSFAFNKKYDDEIFRRMWNELRLSRSLQRLCTHPRLFNFIFRRAAKSKHWHDFLVQALSNADVKRQFINPLFYYKLLFG